MEFSIPNTRIKIFPDAVNFFLLSLFQYNYNRERAEPGQQRRTPTELELNSELEAARPQTAGKKFDFLGKTCSYF